MFLTLPDPRAAVQGSRDPLGVQPLWTAFGRRIVRNLTTVTTSVRSFTIHLLGRYYTERLIEEGKAKEEDAIGIFLRMEQVGAYVRYAGHGVDNDIRGIERVQAIVDEHGGKVPIGTENAALILSDQKTYGLWGLYTASARVSGLCAEGPVGLTERARAFVESYYVPRIGNADAGLRSLLLKGGTLHASKNNKLFNTLCAALPEKLSSKEIAFYGSALRDAEWVDTNLHRDRQATFARLLDGTVGLNNWLGREAIMALAKAARRKDEGLAVDLEKILRLEALLAPAESLFGYLQARHDQKIDDVGSAIREHWGRVVPNLDTTGRNDLGPQISEIVGGELAAIMERCDAALAKGDYRQVVNDLLAWNAMIMQRRDAAPWIRKHGKKLDVHYHGTEQELPDKQDLPTLWRNSYFFDALRVVTRTVGVL